jgi:hypothetical protein
MAREINPLPTTFLKLSTTAQVLKGLDELVARGMWGKTRSEVAESLVREQLRAELRQLSIPFLVTRRKGPKRMATKTTAAKRRAS